MCSWVFFCSSCRAYILHELICPLPLIKLSESYCFVSCGLVTEKAPTVSLVICWLTRCHFPPSQMFRWCPRWCQPPTVDVWRSASTASLWTWTRQSTSTMTFAPTPAPCWTPSSDPNSSHTQFIHAMGDDFQFILSNLWPVGRCFRLEC